MRLIIDVVEKITGVRPKNHKQIKGELIAFLNEKGAGDLVVDDDIQMLIEMCIVYSDLSSSEIITRELLDELYEKPLYKRVGPRLIPKTRLTDKRVVEKFAELIVSLHPDLHFTLKKHGVAFLDDINVVFSFEQFRAVEDVPNEYSGWLVFPRIRTAEDAATLIPENYRDDKKWVFKTLRKKYSRLEGRYFTITEALDLLTNRKIITHGNHR